MLGAFYHEKKKILNNLSKEPQPFLEFRPTEVDSGMCIFYHYVMNSKYTPTLFNTAVRGDNKQQAPFSWFYYCLKFSVDCALTARRLFPLFAPLGAVHLPSQMLARPWLCNLLAV